MSDSSQKYIARNRAPRVQIEYEVETYGSTNKIELPFVMGVMADLHGTPDPENKPPRVVDRTFAEIRPDNFDNVMAGMKPRAAFKVENKLAPEGEASMLSVDLRFESLEDFSPARVAERVAGVKQLMEMRQKLANLAAWMDGKSEAEEEMARCLQDLSKFKELVATLSAGKQDKPADAESGTSEQE